MTIVSLIVWLVVLGVVAWLINSFIPMEATIKRILNIVLIVIAIVIVLFAFGILPMGGQRVPQIQ
jgi:membrane protein DedA with SNARE-associated domain